MPYQPGQVACESYQILELLEPQAVGALYRAERSDSRVPVLLLAVSPALLVDEPARQRLIRKVRLARGLRVPGLARMLDVRADGETVLIAAQWVGGETLRSCLARERRRHPPAEAWALLQPIAAAVAALHVEGEVLGDLRAETVLISPEGVKLFNHGVGLSLARDRFLAAMARTGDLASVAPEVRQGRAAGVCADVFSLAALGCELVTGERPTLGGAIEDASPFGRVLERALAPEARDRPLNVQAFCRELAAAAPASDAAAAAPASDGDEADGGFGDSPKTREFDAQEILSQDGAPTRPINLNQLADLIAKSRVKDG